jgi:hypothetical protein
VEALLRGKRLRFELRASGPEEVSYEVQLPQRHRTDRIANEILALQPGGKLAVTWDEKDK